MPKRDEELEYEYDEETEDLDEDEYEYEDDEDEEEGEYDDDYEDDDEEEEESGGGGLRRILVFALAGVVAVGGGVYAYLNGMLPFSPKAPETVQASTSPYANPNGFGKVKASAAPTAAKPASKSAKADAQADNSDEKTAPTKTAAKPTAPKHVETKVNADQATKVAAKPHAAVKPIRPVPKVKPAMAARPVPKHPAAVAHVAGGSGHYSIQCGAFASQANASNLARVLGSKGFQAWLSNGSGTPTGAYSVRSTVVNSKAKANQLRAKFASAGHPGAIVPAGRGRYVLQLGIFSSRASAQALATELKGKGMFVSVGGGKARIKTLNRVYVGRYATMAQAQAFASKIRHQGVPANVVRI